MYISRKKLDDSSIIRICQFRGYVRLNRSRVYVLSFLDINIISSSVSLSFVFVFFFFLLHMEGKSDGVCVHASSISGFPGSCKILEEMSS